MRKQATNRKNTKAQSKKKSLQPSMFRRPHFIAMIAFVVLFAGIAVYSLRGAFAGTGQLYLTPTTTTIQQGQNFSVSVRLSPGTAVDGVEATLAYDPAVVEYVSSDSSESPFTTQLQATGGAGTVKLARGTFGEAITTDSQVATITFKALVAAQNSPLTLTGNAVYKGTLTEPAAAGGVVTVLSTTTPVPPADTSAPTVRIVQPADNSAVGKGGKVTVTAAAQDDSGSVVKMEVVIDGSVMQTSITDSISYVWNAKPKQIAKGEHTITVKAYDGAGNVGSTSVRVVK